MSDSFQPNKTSWSRWRNNAGRFIAVPLAFGSLILSTECLAADPILKPVGSNYILDTFEDVTKSNTIWYYASCNQTPHMSSDKKFKLFGTAARPGYCATIQDKNMATGAVTNSYMRFITMPFDRRDAEVVFDSTGKVISDNYAPNGSYTGTVDVRKGGSEMRGNVARFTYSATSPEGWDHRGENYLNPDNTVQYSWRFRLSDISILQKDSNGVKLATSAVVGQFHSQSSPACNTKAAYESGFSPSPGLEVKVIDATETTLEQVQFTLRANLRASQIPPGGEQCPEGRDRCVTTLWQAAYPTPLVARADNKVPAMNLPWINVSYVMRNANDSKGTGAMRFYFGVDGAMDPSLEYKRRILNGENSVTKALHIPTTQNECPNVPYLGSYVLGYDVKNYGYDVGSTNSTWRVRSNSTWLSPYITGDAVRSIPVNTQYMSYIGGTWSVLSPPPQLMVDYDNFRVLQTGNLPAKP